MLVLGLKECGRVPISDRRSLKSRRVRLGRGLPRPMAGPDSRVTDSGGMSNGLSAIQLAARSDDWFTENTPRRNGKTCEQMRRNTRSIRLAVHKLFSTLPGPLTFAPHPPRYTRRVSGCADRPVGAAQTGHERRLTTVGHRAVEAGTTGPTLLSTHGQVMACWSMYCGEA